VRPAKAEVETPEAESVARMPAKDYMDRFVNPPAYLEAQRKKREQQAQVAKRFPPRPERDVLGFLLEHAPLENWERDIVGMLREEAYYFLPQLQTKVMNEGWASYWHSKIMTERALSDAEVVDYADHHSGTMAAQPGRLNPYKLGLELFRDIERRWDRGQFGPEWENCEDMAARNAWDKRLGQGRQKIFEVRRVYCDATFLDEFLTPEFCEEHQLFVSRQDPKTKRSQVSSRDFKEVKQALLFQFTNGGRPVIELFDANFANRGELCLVHRHVGVDLRWDWAKDVLASLVLLWKRPVRIETRRTNRAVRLGYDGQSVSEDALIEQAG
jgi:stage V sporulation protein R